MIDFKPVNIEDKELLTAYYAKINYRNCDFAFASLFCWQTKYHTSYAELNGFLLVRFLCDDGLPCFMMPVGTGNLKAVLNLMINDAESRGDRFRIHAITSEMFVLLEGAMPHTFSFIESRDFFEYLYLSDDLAQLTGKKYQAKRNHINRFKKENPDFEVLQISRELIPQCLELYNRWADLHLQRYPDEDLVDERMSVLRAFENYEALGLQGLILRRNNEAVAFTYGEPLTEDTYAVHAEKALHEVHGSYAIINQQFARFIASRFLYINREEDLGIESLRQAKLSYQPYKLLRRGSVELL